MCTFVPSGRCACTANSIGALDDPGVYLECNSVLEFSGGESACGWYTRIVYTYLNKYIYNRR